MLASMLAFVQKL